MRIASRQDPVVPSDDLGAGFNGCRSRLRVALAEVGVTTEAWAKLDAELEALAAEITADGSRSDTAGECPDLFAITGRAYGVALRAAHPRSCDPWITAALRASQWRAKNRGKGLSV